MGYAKLPYRIQPAYNEIVVVDRDETNLPVISNNAKPFVLDIPGYVRLKGNGQRSATGVTNARTSSLIKINRDRRYFVSTYGYSANAAGVCYYRTLNENSFVGAQVYPATDGYVMFTRVELEIPQDAEYFAFSSYDYARFELYVEGARLNVTLFGVANPVNAHFNLSGILRKHLKPFRSILSTIAGAAWAWSDSLFCIRYDIPGYGGFVINAVKQPGESLNLMNADAGFVLLEKSKRSDTVLNLPKYEGYPVGFCIIYRGDPLGAGDGIRVTGTPATGSAMYFDMDLENGVHSVIEFIAGAAPDLKFVDVFDYNGERPNVRVNFVDTCIPSDPLYIRWINQLGGYEYKMFDAGYRKSLNVSNFETFTPKIYDTLNTRRTKYVLDFEAKRTIVVGDEQLDADEFNRLSNLALSSNIEYFDRDRGAWFGVTLDNNYTGVWNAKTTRGTIEFTFRLPEMIKQV